MPSKGDTKHNPDRLIATWTFVYDALIDPENQAEADEVEEADDNETPKPGALAGEKRVDVKVYMEVVTRMAAAPPHPPDRVKFRVRCDNPRLVMEGTDLEALRAAMFGTLQKEFEIKWESYFLVEISPGYAAYGESTILFSYKDVEKGTAHDGALLMRKFDGRSRGDNWKISPWPGRFTNRNGKVIACIPATKENRAAMQEFGERIVALREKLAKLLEPENIMQTLAAMTGAGFLLPAREDSTEGAEATPQ